MILPSWWYHPWPTWYFFLGDAKPYSCRQMYATLTTIIQLFRMKCSESLVEQTPLLLRTRVDGERVTKQRFASIQSSARKSRIGLIQQIFCTLIIVLLCAHPACSNELLAAEKAALDLIGFTQCTCGQPVSSCPADKVKFGRDNNLKCFVMPTVSGMNGISAGWTLRSYGIRLWRT